MVLRESAADNSTIGKQINKIPFMSSMKEPFVILFSAFRELTGGVTKEKAVCDAVVNATELGEDCFTVYKIGMKIKVCIPVNEKTESHIREKEKMLGTLRQNYESAEIEFVIR